ncbi:MAG: septum formation protein Maf [Bdellovibrionales bacterium GWB1_55_8]|nr:MAG: septum formation protein Maf [Bdellovibrionales bacterium GWB1_55_8]
MYSPSQKPVIVLASTSPRRIELLKQVGLNPVVLSPHADETALPRETPKQTVARLAREKAKSLSDRVFNEHGNALIIAADTIVVSPKGKVFNKPRDRAEAIRMLGVLAGNTHTVLTGYCILSAKRTHVRVISSRVRMRKLPRRDIERYVDSGEPMDKAGAYAAQGLGMALIERISGSYMNVVGLPVAQVLQDAENLFDFPLFSWELKR